MGKELGKEITKYISGMPLKHLDLTNTEVDPKDFLPYLSSHPSLTHVNLQKNTRVALTDEGKIPIHI